MILRLDNFYKPIKTIKVKSANDIKHLHGFVRLYTNFFGTLIVVIGKDKYIFNVFNNHLDLIEKSEE